MPAQVMEVVKAEKHPYADTLFVYTFKSPAIESLQIVANSENIYKVGDLANIALENSTLKDGTRIKKANLRGINSFGMAVGFAAESSKAGDDVTDQFCMPPSQELTHISWPSIENLYNVVKNVDGLSGYLDYNSLSKEIKYKFKVKLDGCFIASTKITMANGNYKYISNIKIGEEVLGVDELGRITSTKVINVFNNGKSKDGWVSVKGCRVGVGRGKKIFSVICTPDHLFWVDSKAKYIKAKHLTNKDVVCLHRYDYGLTPIQEQVLLGKMLGDGTMSSTKWSSNIEWGHAVKDIKYTKWTIDALGDLCKGRINFYKSGYGTDMARCRTVNSSNIKDKFSSFIGKNGKKKVPEWVINELTPIAIAFWYMDDGSLASNEKQEDRVTFSVCDFSKKDCLILIQALKKFNIDSRLAFYDYNYIVLNEVNAEKLFLLVAPYIPKCMQRKLPKRYRGGDGWLPKNEKMAYKPSIIKQKVISVTQRKHYSNKYDIQTETNNYFANNVLVHNSNASVQIKNGNIGAQSRSNLITPQHDNAGFARFVDDNLDYFKSIKPERHAIIFSEWCMYHDTPVLLADGTPKKIGEIVNEKLQLNVLTYNFDKKTFEPKPIIAWHKQDDNNDWLTIRIKRRHKGGKSTNLILTKNHNVFVKRNCMAEKIPASQIKVGDTVFINGRSMTYYQRQFIMGSLLGDGSFVDYGAFSCGHSNDDQPWYNTFIDKLLNSIIINRSARISGHGSNMSAITTISLSEIKDFQDILIKNGIKMPTEKYLNLLHPPALAAWYMDDGNIASGKNNRQFQCELNTQSFGKKGNLLIVKWLIKHGYDSYICKSKTGYIIRFSPVGTEAFLKTIAPYILKEFNYKLPWYLQDVAKFDWNDCDPYDNLLESNVIEICDGNKYKEPYKRRRYNITVKDNHNFFANHVLVSNCGTGIQKRTAISSIDRKIMAVFAIQYGDGTDGLPVEFEVEPENIRKLLPEHRDIFVLPWYGPELTLNFNNKESLQPNVDIINSLVEEVERCDPWVKVTFGLEGLGEGIVSYPLNPSGGKVSRDYWTGFAFKAKGEKHKVVNTKKPAQLEPEFVSNIDDFVKLFVTEARLEQGVMATGGKYEMSQMGEFLKWFGQDVKKESVAELEKAGLEWKQVSNFIVTAARNWYKEKAAKI